MDDSFAERMRNRALQRLQKNAHILKNNNLNKENISENENVDVDIVKPVIAEHLTIKKSLSRDKIDCDDKESKKTNNTRDFVLSERNNNEEKRDEIFVVRHRKNELTEPSYSEERREDVYVKHCKNRLANLAGKFKQFEEEDSHVPLRPTAPKQTTVKRRSPEKESSIAHKAGKYEPMTFKNKENKLGYSGRRPEKSPVPQNHVPAKKEKLDTEQHVIKALSTPEKKVLDQSVVKTLESQGYKRTESDAHLIFDFKKARSVFDKNNESSCSKKENSTDPSLLSVAERRKLFEKRLRGEDVPTTFGYSNSPVSREPENITPVRNENGDDQRSKSSFVNHNQISDQSEESNDSVKSDSSDHSNKPDEPKEDVVLNISEETCSSFPDASNDQDANVSVYPVLQTVKQVKFVSTPKPGRLYPSMSDLDCDADESSDDNEDEPRKDNSKLENSFSFNEHDNSFGRDVLFATNSIFSSFQNSRREMSGIQDKTNTDILTEVKELISPDNNDTSLSLSPVARSSLNSVECPNETASFTYMKTYSDASIHLSPISPSTSKNNSKNVLEKFDFDEQINDEKEDAFKKNELDVGTKIKLLEEHIIKEKIMLTQAVRALKLCLSTSFLNSLSHLEAEKVVLLSQLKIVAAQTEIDRIKVENSVLPRSSASNSARGNVILSNIKLPVRMAVVHADLKDDVYNNLLCVIKCGDIVLSTGVVPVTQTNIKQDPECTYVEFGDTITVSNVSSDFKITVEVYNLVVERKDPSNSKHHQSTKKDKKSHHGSKKEKESRIFPRHNDDKRHSQSSFFMVGYMIFSLNEVRRHQWILNKDLHHTPLVGMIMINLKCNLALTTVQKHGFLTMYEVISGYGAWSRYWFYLSGEKLSFWKYPEEENVKDPVGSFDLKKCCSNLVDVVGIEITMRPHTFRLEFNPPSYLLEFKSLTEEGLLLSADNLEERIAWCLCLNEVLKSVRLWSNAVD